MTIGTLSDLQTTVVKYLNQTDADTVAQVPDFINRAHAIIQEYTGVLDVLVNPTDTNALLQYDPYIYLDGAVAEGFKFLRDTAQYETYYASFKSRLQRLAATGYARLNMPPATKPPRSLFPIVYGRGAWGANACG